MDQKQIFKQMVEFNHTVFNNFFQALALFQGQFERIASAALDQATGLPPESRQFIENWDKSFNAACDNFKSNVDYSYKQIEKYLVG
ncbi:conserved hypothetical protein [Desulfosarcina cetonica]|uniref:hypothetical protein n=1 Tax=Desulfosarcina cetonica TaxID=90730 RepID=UPI0006D1BA42|nr:hypothetical protein [Desulfosarcina cetonica]VTR69419.1 conserved hypothetical protein [Desulfosarcina cetonica]